MDDRNRESGSLLLEVAVGGMVLTIGLLGFCAFFAQNVQSAQVVEERDEVRVALERVAETLRSQDFSSLYATYNGATFEVPYLKQATSTAGGTTATTTADACPSAYVQSSFYVNEQAIPAEFGPITDLDGNISTKSTNCSASYKLLPVRLSLTYSMGTWSETHEQYVLLGAN